MKSRTKHRLDTKWESKHTFSFCFLIFLRFLCLSNCNTPLKPTNSATSIVRIHEIDPINGEYLRLLNTSNNVDYDLAGHFLQQNVACVPTCRFRFPLNTIIRAGQSITVKIVNLQFSMLHRNIWLDLLWSTEKCRTSTTWCSGLERTETMAIRTWMCDYSCQANRTSCIKR